MISGLKRSETIKRATEILSYLGLGRSHQHRRPNCRAASSSGVAIRRLRSPTARVLFASSDDWTHTISVFQIRAVRKQARAAALATARAIATAAARPPDSSAGRCLMRSPRPR